MAFQLELNTVNVRYSMKKIYMFTKVYELARQVVTVAYFIC